METLQTLRKRFIEQFGDGGEIRTFFAPGRVNLIGDHTDYNGGHVLPCALSIGTYAVVRKRLDDRLRCASLNFTLTVDTSVNGLAYDRAHDWANYPKGVVHMVQAAGYPIENGFDVLFYGTIPNGAGLSSSASIELATIVALAALFHLDIPMIEMVKLSQKAENQFMGMNCGIMDQFAVGMGKKEHAIFLDCATLDYTYVPVVLPDASILIANTNKRRGLVDSQYNTRRKECEDALASLQQQVTIHTLGDLSPDEFERYAQYIGDPVKIKRTRHAVYENQRTVQAAAFLSENKLAAFGQLMNESHSSLRDDYEVTGFELDALVNAAWAQNGVVGARMTGGGFGGSTVSIVKNDCITQFIENTGRIYTEKTGLQADFYIVEIGGGAREVTDE